MCVFVSAHVRVGERERERELLESCFLRLFGYDVIYFENSLIIIVRSTKGEGIMECVCVC